MPSQPMVGHAPVNLGPEVGQGAPGPDGLPHVPLNQLMPQGSVEDPAY
jgi:hypothetical protein